MTPILRAARARDARAIHRLITAHEAEGHLLPRTLDEIRARARGFVVAHAGQTIIACGELAPLGVDTAEIRSLVVDDAWRGAGLGRAVVDALRERAEDLGFSRLCAFTHTPGWFTRFGFAVVAHGAVPEKIELDCRRCPRFGACGQYAVVMELTPRTLRLPAREAPAAVPSEAQRAGALSPRRGWGPGALNGVGPRAQ